ncbi:hypothetical protein OAL67_00490 [bacterium]|nr:hypothetical protein [bacterium]
MSETATLPDLLRGESDVRRADFELSPPYEATLERSEDGSYITGLAEFDDKPVSEQIVLLYLEMNEIFGDKGFTEDVMTTVSLAGEVDALTPWLITGKELKIDLAKSLKAFRSGRYQNLSKEDLKLILVQQAALSTIWNLNVFHPGVFSTEELRDLPKENLAKLPEASRERIENINSWLKDLIDSKLGGWLPEYAKEEGIARGTSHRELGIISWLDIPLEDNDVLSRVEYQYSDGWQENPTNSYEDRYERRTFGYECWIPVGERAKDSLWISYDTHNLLGKDPHGMFWIRADEFVRFGDTEFTIYVRDGEVTTLEVKDPGMNFASRSNPTKKEFEKFYKGTDTRFSDMFGITIKDFVKRATVEPTEINEPFVKAAKSRDEKPSDFEGGMDLILKRLNPKNV